MSIDIADWDAALDSLHTRPADSITASEFSKNKGISRRNAQYRLDVLVAAGKAERHHQGHLVYYTLTKTKPKGNQ